MMWKPLVGIDLYKQIMNFKGKFCSIFQPTGLLKLLSDMERLMELTGKNAVHGDVALLQVLLHSCVKI